MAKKDDKKQVNVCWLSGNFRQRQQIISKVRDFLASKGPYETSVFDGSYTFEYIRGQIIQNISFEEQQRLIFINEWPSFKTTKPTMLNHFLKMCEQVGPDTVVICNNLPTESEKFLEKMDELARMYRFETEVKQYQAAHWVTQELAKREMAVSERDAQGIVLSVGTKENGYTVDIDKLYTAIDRLCVYMGRRKNITADDIATVCSDSSDFVVWNLYPLLDAKNFPAAMKLIARAIDVAKDSKDFVEEVLYSMIWRYRILLFAKEGTALGWDTSLIAENAAKLIKLKRSGSDFSVKYSIEEGTHKPIYPQKVVEKLFDARFSRPPVLCYSRKELFEIVQAVEQTLQRSREGIGEYERIILLDSVIMTICNLIDNDLLSELRRSKHGRVRRA